MLNRGLSEAIIFTYGTDKQIRTLALVNPYDRPLEKVITPQKIDELKKQASAADQFSRTGSARSTRLDYGPDTYLYAARVFDPQLQQQISGANDVMQDYQALLARSRINQLRFNAALLLGALIIVGLAIFTALKLADRLVRPVGRAGRRRRAGSRPAISRRACRSPTPRTKSRRWRPPSTA